MTATGLECDGEWICDPFRVVAQTRPEGGDNWGVMLAWHDDDELEHRVIVSQAMLTGDERSVFERLSARGLRLYASRSARTALVNYLSLVRSTKKARTVSRIGWVLPADGGAAYVLPRRVCGTPADGEELFLDIDPPPRVFRERGSLDDWKQDIAARCVGNSRLVLAVAVAFAGPLLTPLGEETGGIHFRGGSSVGKTTALHLTASAWGAPSGPDAFVRQWRATINGVEEMAKTYSDCVLPLDEIGQADPTKVGDMVYMLANEAGSARMRDRGGLRTMNTWRLLFVSSGEEGIVSLMNRGKVAAKAGQETRFLDIPADAGRGLGMFEKLHDADSGALFSRQLKQAAQDCHGHAGPAFVAWLAARVADPAWLDATRARLQAIAAAMLPHGADGQVQRAAGRFALIALAGELATEANVTGWPLGEAERAAEACFTAWLESRGSVGPLELRNVLRAVRGFLLQHGASRFETLKEPLPPGDLAGTVAPPDTRTIERAGWKWTGEEADEGTKLWVYGIQPETFEKEVVPAGMSELEAKRMLAAAGVLKTQMKGGKLRFTLPKSVKGVGRPELVTILPSIFADEGDEG
ncbi:DUF927 domain-containing protein [Elioraea sp.]|uniref:DUF927 domain-containing protein n=1 Tax=Elioraea sp. TaxID=2185103 RepID=UPI0025BE4975|nr:DUF927 domain-containing protein [Elioraea sp.]